jgi:hypothetical protein
MVTPLRRSPGTRRVRLEAGRDSASSRESAGGATGEPDHRAACGSAEGFLPPASIFRSGMVAEHRVGRCLDAC